MDQFPSAPFLRDPITVPRSELIGQYRAQAARYQQLAERQRRSSVYEGLLALARQCAAMADALASPKGDQSAKAQLSEPEILLLLNRVLTEQKPAPPATPDRPQPPPLIAGARELSLDEILEKIQRDIAEGRPAAD
jgi:hypothetical protein